MQRGRARLEVERRSSLLLQWRMSLGVMLIWVGRGGGQAEGREKLTALVLRSKMDLVEQVVPLLVVARVHLDPPRMQWGRLCSPVEVCGIATSRANLVGWDQLAGAEEADRRTAWAGGHSVACRPHVRAFEVGLAPWLAQT